MRRGRESVHSRSIDYSRPPRQEKTADGRHNKSCVSTMMSGEAGGPTLAFGRDGGGMAILRWWHWRLLPAPQVDGGWGGVRWKCAVVGNRLALNGRYLQAFAGLRSLSNPLRAP